MPTILRNTYVFGPIHSRRLGTSLGINVLPTIKKVCNFNCIYCECGWNDKNIIENPLDMTFPTPDEIKIQLENILHELSQSKKEIDVITFSGNGEPTLHPDFYEIICNTIDTRNKYYPKAKISVLSNSTMLLKKNVFEALIKIENPILKIDSANIETLEKINLQNIKNIFKDENNPTLSKRKISIEKIIAGMKQFNGNFIMQTMFLRSIENGKIAIDNTTEEEIQGLINVMTETNPRQIMIYPIDRETPAKNLIKLDTNEMQRIADTITKAGFNVMFV